MNRPPPQDFPWSLRLLHEGMLSLRIERKGRRLRFDPQSPPESGDITILTGGWPEQIEATAEAARAGARPSVVTSAEVGTWLKDQGEIEELSSRTLIDDLMIESEPYTPISYATPKETLHKASSALRRPDRALRRLLRRARGPLQAAPHICHITFPDGRRLLHLHLALHSSTPGPWLDRVVERWAGADWLVVGVDHGEEAAVLDLLPRLAARKVLVTDLVSEVRRGLGLPTGLLTPMVDTARDRGIDAYIVVSGASMRFE